MNYQILARKWRPKTFFDVLGQEHVLQAIMNSLSSGKIHHAYLLSGTRGIGKTTIARLIAKGLSCKKNITANICKICDNCQKIDKCCFIDVIEIDAASRTKVEDIKELLNTLQYVPSIGRFKIYIIDEVHMLSKYSFNALLKIMEEPPYHVKFIMATTDLRKLPTTILSRCLHFNLKSFNIEQIYSFLLKILKKENINFETSAIKILANAANGSIRDALTLTDQAIAMGNIITIDKVNAMLGLININYPLSIVESLINGSINSMMKIISDCSDLNVDWEKLILDILSLLHRILIGKLFNKYYFYENEYVLKILKKLSYNSNYENINKYYKIIILGRKEINFAPTPRLGLEMILLRAILLNKNNKI